MKPVFLPSIPKSCCRIGVGAKKRLKSDDEKIIISTKDSDLLTFRKFLKGMNIKQTEISNVEKKTIAANFGALNGS